MAGVLSGIRWLRGLTWRAGNNLQAGEMPDPPHPDVPVAVIGDIHGRADLLDKLLEQLARDAPDAMLVFVGDYVDRGADSRGVIERLMGLGAPAVFLKGNHEVMLLEFLDDPIEKGGRWLRNGGIETLASYGISLDETSNTQQVLGAGQALQAALSDGAGDWLRALPLFWKSGNLLVTHAGPNPALAIEYQDDRDFLWGHSRFLRDPRGDGIWVAHGHWARDQATCKDGRIAVDTGAWRSGVLTAALIRPDGSVAFIDTR